ncbi:MAG: hypothetical protein KIS91_01580 [Anaerolineae bacterium]|nr:hypothetical protein [Anaerolineae bacterium]
MFYIGNRISRWGNLPRRWTWRASSAVVLPIDATTARGAKVYSNEQIAELCAMSDFIGFASVDPHNPANAPGLRAAIR